MRPIPEESIPNHKVSKVELDGLVLSQILQGSGAGVLLGVEEGGRLTLTNSFQFPPTLNSFLQFPPPPPHVKTGLKSGENSVVLGGAEGGFEDENSIKEFHQEMIQLLKGMEYETNQVGWYSTYTGLVLPIDEIIDAQFAQQSENDQAIHIMYEPSQSEFQPPKLTALRLTDQFVKFYANKTFTGKAVKESKITFQDIFEFLPIQLNNSFLLNAVYGSQVPEIQTCLPSHSLALSSLTTGLVTTSEKIIERQMEGLIECAEDIGQEFWRWQSWNRGYHKEHQKVNATLSKMNAENEARVARGGAPLHGTEALAAAATSIGLAKGIAGEPGRLDTLVLSKNIEMITTCLVDFTSS